MDLPGTEEVIGTNVAPSTSEVTSTDEVTGTELSPGTETTNGPDIQLVGAQLRLSGPSDNWFDWDMGSMAVATDSYPSKNAL